MRGTAIILVFLAVWVFAGCDAPLGIDDLSDGTLDDLATGTLQLSITDAPIDGDTVESVWITITELEFQYNGEWLSSGLIDTPYVVDLLTLTHGSTATFDPIQLPVGEYSNVRFILDIEVEGSGIANTGCFIEFTDGSTEQLFVPSGEQSGYKALGNYVIAEDQPLGVTVDFDLRRSVVRKGNGAYLLKPVLRLFQNDSVGSITVPVDEGPTCSSIVVFAYEDGTYTDAEALDPADGEARFPNAVNSVNADANGDYIIPFLPEGTFDVVLACFDGEVFVAVTDEINDVIVMRQNHTEITPSYSIYYYQNGADSGIAPVDSAEYSAGEAAQVQGPGTLTREGYSFLGWNTENDGSGSTLSDGELVAIADADMHLYAKWSVDSTTMLWGGSGNDLLVDVAVLENGDYIVGGTTYSTAIDGLTNAGQGDFYFARIGPDGNIIWQNTIGGSLNEMMTALLVASDGTIVATGQSNSTDIAGINNSDLKQIYVVKISPDGQIIWQRMFGGYGTEYAQCISETASGAFLVGGITYSSELTSDTDGDAYLVKISADGNLVWARVLGGTFGENFSAVMELGSGNYLAVGNAANANLAVGFSDADRDFFTAEYSSTGQLVDQAISGGNSWDVYTAIERTPVGYLVAGMSASTDLPYLTNSGHYDYYVATYDALGTEVWTLTFGGNDQDSGTVDAIALKDGGYLISGTSYSATIGSESNHGAEDGVLFQVSESGSVIWNGFVGGSRNENLQAIVEDSIGGIVGVGMSVSTDIPGTTTFGSADFYLVKLSPAISGYQ